MVTTTTVAGAGNRRHGRTALCRGVDFFSRHEKWRLLLRSERLVRNFGSLGLAKVARRKAGVIKAS
jgi:hypothetical protein